MEWGSYFDPKLKLDGIKLNISNWKTSTKYDPMGHKAAGLYMIYFIKTRGRSQRLQTITLDHEGNIAEATGANIFFKDKLENCIHLYLTPLDGITRREIIKIAKSKGIKVIERKIKPDEMKTFEGCFLTGTAAEVTPVSQISEFNFKVCNVITDLSDCYQGLVRNKSAA